MTVAGRINLTVGFVALLAAGLLSFFLCLHQFQTEKRLLLRDLASVVASRPELQADMYLRDAVRMQSALQALLAVSPAVQRAALLNGDGEILAERHAVGNGSPPRLSFDRARDNADALATTLITVTDTESGTAHSPLATITGGERVMHLTTPVFSLLSPIDKGLSRNDFARALADPSANASRHVMGYVQLAMSRTTLLSDALPSLSVIALANLVFAAFCVLMVRLSAGRITRPLNELSAVAERIASGTQDRTISVSGSSEIRDLAAALNTMIESLSSYRARTGVDQTLLRMKVDERTEQLSTRNRELNAAVREATEARNRLRHMAYYDSLTALPNRRLFTEQLDLLLRLSRRNRQLLALLFLDLDNFKRINDSLGHAAGDLLLKEVANRLTSCVRDSDVVAHLEDPEQRPGVSRLGGDEFTVILNQLNEPETAGLVAERLLTALTEPVTIEGHEIVVTPSIGIAVAPRDGDSIEELLRAADTAMYHAKRGGKSNCVFYNPDMDAAGIDRLELETDLRRALERKELQLYYQPQVDSRSGSVVGVESLVRWLHPQRGMVSPAVFIPLAEEMGLIGDIGNWCLHQACVDMVSLKGIDTDLSKVAVNISALQFDPRLIEQVDDALARTGLDPRSLSLELTEGIAVESGDQPLNTMHGLKGLGVQLSIDDFGTGYSSLGYLSRFPLDELKIDRSFVDGVERENQQAALVAAIIAMSNNLGLEVVAEGVETSEQFRHLTGQGARIFQGYLFSKPLPLEELHEVLRPGRFASKVMDITGVIETIAERAEPSLG
ncbi:EAL domain-containing protein [Parahaliea maris]|uniref:cyclic-guanylate-specific phosphodiesterase n=1 Tax=Parahaliea maris TaxID=2716870 RepID=A0A5C9A9U7_9GAMM|nr:EAL domain-containing protein [Parahaliea maris]TXS96051.1 EAL domain-containing protein [Parahaliea maris]